MKTKQILSFLLVICVVCSCASAFASAGGQDDPLVSRNYVDYSYESEVFESALSSLSESMTVLRYKLKGIDKSADIAPGGMTLKAGDTLSAEPGASFTVLSGSLTVSGSTGSLIDVTSGSAASVSKGTALSAGHRYVCAESSTIKLLASSDVSLGVMGSVVKSAAEKVSFNDVPAGSWFYDDVYYAVEKGLVNGKTAVTYVPDGSLSYAEAIKLAACMNQLYTSGSVSLENAASGQWYDSYVSYALENGIISSAYPNYDAAISRSEFVAIFYNSMPASAYTKINSVADNAIPDVAISAAHGKEIYAFYRAGILTGSDSAGTFYPDSSIKRSEVAAVITRMYEAGKRKAISL